MHQSRRFAVVAFLALTSHAIACSSGDDGTGVELRIPAAMQIVDGDAQDGVVGEELAEPLIVRVVDENGDPVPDQLVNFRVLSGGGDVFAGSNLTNAQGIVQERWTLGTSTSEEQRVEARAVDRETGQAIVFATFTATPLPAPLAALQKLSGDAQPGQLGVALAQPLVVRAVDQYGNPIRDVEMTWSVPSGGGALGTASSTTGADGTASATWTLGPTLGHPQVARASAGTFSVTFNATPSLPADVVVTRSGGGQTGTVGEALANPLVVRVTLAGGVPIPGATITWSTAGGALAPAQAVTDDEGRASAAWTLGPTVGAQQATAQVSGAGTVEFLATARPGAPASLHIISGSAQAGVTGTQLPLPLVLEVRDEFGNVVPGVAVTWSVALGGGTLVGAAGTTDDAGRAQTSYVLGPLAGGNEVRAVVGALPPASFTAEARAGSAARLEKISGDGQEGRVGVLLPELLVVRVRDQNGNPVANALVTGTVESGGASFSTTVEARAYDFRTDAEGFVRVPLLLGGELAPTRVRFTTGDESVAFTATARPFTVEKLVLDSPACGLTADGRLVCWSPMSITSPTTYQVPALRFSSASISQGHGCGVDAAATMWCWGSNRVGQLGDGTFTSGGPVRPLPDVPVARVLTGYFNSCAVAEDGRVYCWGVGSSANSVSCRSVFFANDFVSCTPIPTERPAVRGIASFDLAMGLGAYAQSAHGLIDGSLHSWHPVSGSPTPSSLPFPPLAVVDHGQSHLCGLTSSGEAWCHGRYGVVGDGSSYLESLTATRRVAGGHTFVSISAGSEETCALTADGDAYCWGQHFGRVPTLVPGGLLFREVRAGRDGLGFPAACGVTTSGALACWGFRDGGRTLQLTPVYVSWPSDP